MGIKSICSSKIYAHARVTIIEFFYSQVVGFQIFFFRNIASVSLRELAVLKMKGNPKNIFGRKLDLPKLLILFFFHLKSFSTRCFFVA